MVLYTEYLYAISDSGSTDSPRVVTPLHGALGNTYPLTSTLPQVEVLLRARTLVSLNPVNSSQDSLPKK